MKNVLVTAAGSPLGRRVIHRLREHAGVEHLLGLEPEVSSDWSDDAELVPFPSDHREFVELLAQYPIDTLIHCGMAPDRSGSRSLPCEARVVETMQIGAAVASPNSSVRSWVIASSSDVYPISSHAPLLQREHSALDATEEGIGASLREAEEYARDIADRRPHLDVAILRLQHVVGDEVHSPMTALLDQPLLPNVIGYDAPLQLLELEDAVSAIAFAADLELAGVYNVASAGTIRLSEIAEVIGKPRVPILPMEAPSFLEGITRRLAIPHVPAGLLAVLRFGHALDTSKLASAGFRPAYDQDTCVERFRSRAPRSAGD